jgi:hypothetical protein
MIELGAVKFELGGKVFEAAVVRRELTPDQKRRLTRIGRQIVDVLAQQEVPGPAAVRDNVVPSRVVTGA